MEQRKKITPYDLNRDTEVHGWLKELESPHSLILKKKKGRSLVPATGGTCLPTRDFIQAVKLSGHLARESGAKDGRTIPWTGMPGYVYALPSAYF